MTALTADVAVQKKRKDVRGNDLGAKRALPVWATADEFYNGALIARNIVTGKVAPAGAVGAGDYFAGFCEERKTTSASSSATVAVDVSGPVVLNCAVAGASAASDYGKHVYNGASSDNPADLTLTRPTADACPVGRVDKYVSSNVADVQFFTDQEAREHQLGGGAGQEWMCVLGGFDLADLASSAADILTSYRLKGSGVIKAFALVVEDATTDNDADGAFTLSLTDGACTGTLTTSDTAGTAAIACTPAGLVMIGTITAGGQFHDGDLLSVKGNYATNAYSSGRCSVHILIER